MKAAIGCFIGLVLSVSVGAEFLIEGRVRLESGGPVADAQVRIFDMTDLRRGAIARALTDGTGYFALPLAALTGRALPARFALEPNYPNPFNPSTIIPYQLASSSEVRLEVFNLLGQHIATLVEGARPAGFHTATWTATDGSGRAVAAGVYLYRMTVGEERQTGRMVLIDGQAGRPTAGSGGSAAAVEAAGAAAPVYGLTVSGPGLIPLVDPAFRVAADRGSVDLVVETLDSTPRAKGAATGILGDVDNNAQVDLFDALLVALYSEDASLVLPNHGAISLGDVNADGQVDRADAWLISAYGNDPSDPTLPAGIGKRVSSATASLSPDPSTVSFADDGLWHPFTVQASEPVSVVVNPGATSPRLELTTRSGRDNYCPGGADDAVSRADGEVIYLAGCASGTATVELRRAADDTVLQTYTFTVTASPADLVVSASVSASSLTPGQSFTLSVTVRNQGTASASATTLRYYRSSNRTISWQDTQVGSDAVSALAASATSAVSISLTAPSDVGTYYYGACVERKSGESAGNNCSTGVRVTVGGSSPDLVVQSASVNDNILTTGQAFILRATVQNQGADESPELVLSYYRSSNATISTRDTQVGTDAVGSLAASSIRNESIRLTAPSTPGTYYYGACVAAASDESDTPNNCSSGVSVIVEEDDTPEEEGADGQDEALVFTDPQIYNDNVFVLPVTENLAALWTESGNSPPLQDYTARFYEHFSDEFDFLIFVANVDEIIDLADRPGHITGGFFQRVKNYVQGIGLDTFSDNSSWGSAGKLQGVIFVTDYTTSQLTNYTTLYPGSSLRRGILTHELLHRWAAFLGKPLSDGHWNSISSIRGEFGGDFRSDFEEIVDLGGGRYTAAEVPRDMESLLYGPLDLYLVGFIPPEEVPDMWAAVDGETLFADERRWIYDEAGNAVENFLRDENGDRIFSAREIKKYTIEDIIAEHGPRVPDHLQSQKDFRAAVILLVSEDHPATREILESVSDDVLWFSHAGEDEELEKNYRGVRWNFYEATGGRGTITMDDLSHFQSRASAKRLVPSSFGTPPPPIVDIRE